MLHFGRTASTLAAAAALSLLGSGAAVSKAKKPQVEPAKPVEAAQPANSDKATAGKDATAGKAADANQAAAGESAKPASGWGDAEIADAKAHCAAVLQRIHAVYVAHEPIKQGACGAPAPIELISIGQNPEVTFSPPPVVRCDLAEALVTWLEKDVQPLARKHFGAPIIKIETMSDYSCRNAYGRKTTKLSEHGLANALDIGAFVTASARTATVLGDWGTTHRDMMARLAEAKEAARKQAEALAMAQKDQLAGEKGPGAAAGASESSSSGDPRAGLARATIIEGVPKITITLGKSAAEEKTASVAGEPARLGGPAPQSGKARTGKAGSKDVSAKGAAARATQPPEVQAFLREAHTAACRIFGTTLGPEANADHSNHFHLDMAPRKFKKICD